MKARAYTLDIKYKKQDIFQESKSAKAPGVRDEFNRVVNDIRSGKYNALLCWATNRLARNPQEAGIIQQLLHDGSLKCIITNEKEYRPEDNAVIFAVEMGINSQFIRDLMANVRRGMVSKAEKGWLPGIPPAGYKNNREERTIIVDEERFSLVRQMWDYMLLGCYTVAEITRIADEEWYLTTIPRRKRGGKSLSVACVYSMFRNPFYMGYLRYSGKIYQGKHTAMVTKAEFDRVQELISPHNAPRPETTEEPDPFPYRGLIKCGECGCLITYTRTIRHYKNGESQGFEYCYCTRRRRDYLCTNHISILCRRTPVFRPVVNGSLEQTQWLVSV
jgi:site-specific DNA recombinase